MALATVDFYIAPTDGWVLVATDPVSLLIRPGFDLPWWVAITAGGEPAAGIVGVMMGHARDRAREPFQTGAITGEVYIRIQEHAQVPVQFGVIRDQ